MKLSLRGLLRREKPKLLPPNSKHITLATILSQKQDLHYHDNLDPVSSHKNFSRLVEQTHSLFEQAPAVQENLASELLAASVVKQQYTAAPVQTAQAKLFLFQNRFLFTSWNIPRTLVEEKSELLGHNPRMYLRFSELLVGTKRSRFDIETYGPKGNWYLKTSNSDQKLIFDLILKNELGETVLLASSDELNAPNGSFAENNPTQDEELKQVLGPYFYRLFHDGNTQHLSSPSIEGLFQDVSSFKK